MIKFKVDNNLTKSVDLRINLNLDGKTVVSQSHTQPITLANVSVY
jgi:hypothetical protein